MLMTPKAKKSHAAARPPNIGTKSCAPVMDAATPTARPHRDLVVVCGEDGGMVGELTKTDVGGQITRCAGGSCTAWETAIMIQDEASCRPDDPPISYWEPSV